MKKLFSFAIVGIVMLFIGCEANSPSATNSKGIGVFSVSATKQVTFSPGNLQYQASSDTWRFAGYQWSTIGENNLNISSTYDGWIDLFGWGTGNNPTNTSEEDATYLPFVDWGTNKIGNNAPNTWRTLTYDEWSFLLYKREDASSLWGIAQVNGTEGMVLLPDQWECPSGVTFKAGSARGEMQSYTSDNWNKLEKSGAVFLPMIRSE